MSKHLFDNDSDSDCQLEIKTNTDYAKNYNQWRQKEELHKLQTKYGIESSEGSSSSEDDEDGDATNQVFEKDFLKTLACLKNKDPSIYDQNVRFFGDEPQTSKQKKSTEPPVFLRDYERKLILEKGGQISEDEEEDPRSHSPTYVEEQQKLKENLKKALGDVDEDEEENWGGLFKARQKTEEEIKKEEDDYKEWLIGQKDHLKDEETEKELKPLKEFWSNPKLDEGEKFLRDYILNKRFLEEDDKDYIPTYDEVIHDSDENLSEDEKVLETQEEFEHKYNFRFEEPDQEFIKSYPRTIQNSLRKTDDRRKTKRLETKERKKREKEQKMQEINKLKMLKKKEIEEKIEKLKEITGNTEVAFKMDDLDGDFNPEEYDKRMETLFDEEFYQGPEGDQKPEFSDLDEEIDEEYWKKLRNEREEAGPSNAKTREPHCDDEDFNMDCDYDPDAVKDENSKKKKRNRKTKSAKSDGEPKPEFDPSNEKYEKYLDDYYKHDCEDIIGDIACKFKYRKTVPNSYGLTIEEILMADDKELNRWCSMKKIYQRRPENIEKYEVIAFERKAQNEALKRKYLPSLYRFENEEGKVETTSSTGEEKPETKSKKNRKRRKGKTAIGEVEVKDQPIEIPTNESKMKLEETQIDKKEDNASSGKKNKRKRKNKTEIGVVEVKDESKNSDSVETGAEIRTDESKMKPEETQIDKKDGNTSVGKKKRKLSKSSKDEPSKKRKKVNTKFSPKAKRKPFKGKNKVNAEPAISDARLSAFGIKPKKYKNKLKYGQNQK